MPGVELGSEQVGQRPFGLLLSVITDTIVGELESTGPHLSGQA